LTVELFHKELKQCDVLKANQSIKPFANYPFCWGEHISFNQENFTKSKWLCNKTWWKYSKNNL